MFKLLTDINFKKQKFDRKIFRIIFSEMRFLYFNFILGKIFRKDYKMFLSKVFITQRMQ